MIKSQRRRGNKYPNRERKIMNMRVVKFCND